MACISFCGRIQGTLPFLLRSSVELKQIRPMSACQTWNQDGNMEPMIGRKMVAIIGAGPAGLVAAKSMLEVGLFPTLFDKLPDLGGVWNPQSSSCWFSLRTNDSRYSCCFSDFPWDSDSPIFPSQHDVYGYLQAYANKFLQPVHFCLGSEVTNVSRSNNDKWLVQWSSLEQKYQGSKAGSQIFDFVVFASGFFSIPYTPSIQGLDGFPGEVMHSSEYRSPERFRGKRVVIVGASFSSAEVAADLAPLATEVINIVSRPFWVLPRYIALDPDSASTPFFPLDLVLYRHSTRQSQGEEVFANVEENRKANQYFRKLCGDQGALNLQQDTDPPIIAISDSYLELVRSNHIMVRRGKVQEVQGQTVILEDQTTIPEVDCIIFCTGFQSSMAYLSSDVLDTLSFDPADRFVPFLLHRSTFHPSLPGSAFVGMYRGTFFGVMELQARWAAAIFSGDLPPIPESVQQEGIAFEKWIKSQTPRPQFPHGDYVGFADTFAADLNVLPSKDWYQKHDISIPAHFRRGSVAEEAVEVLEKACKEFLDGKMVPHAVFRSLAGSWTLHRHIENRIDFANSGEVKGTATFSVTDLSHEYLYTEVGELSMQQGQHFRVHRKYVYVYDTNTNQIDVFLKIKGAGVLLSILFNSCPPNLRLPQKKGELKCLGVGGQQVNTSVGEDLYNASYLFFFLRQQHCTDGDLIFCHWAQEGLHLHCHLFPMSIKDLYCLHITEVTCMKCLKRSSCPV